MKTVLPRPEKAFPPITLHIPNEQHSQILWWVTFSAAFFGGIPRVWLVFSGTTISPTNESSANKLLQFAATGGTCFNLLRPDFLKINAIRPCIRLELGPTSSCSVQQHTQVRIMQEAFHELMSVYIILGSGQNEMGLNHMNNYWALLLYHYSAHTA